MMKDIPDASIDLILCDLPYGTTACKWDSVIAFEPLWKEYKRICKGIITLTAAFPFTAILCASQLTMFRYSLVWDKVNKYTGALNANKMPLRRHEDVLVFYAKSGIYNKQYRKGKAFKTHRTGGHGKHTQYGLGEGDDRRGTENDGEHHNPCSVIEIEGDNKKELGLHPTQKPVALMEYLIKTYTDEGMLVLDNCMGSGTTGVACMNTKRRFIGIEKDEQYYPAAVDRINAAYRVVNELQEETV